MRKKTKPKRVTVDAAHCSRCDTIIFSRSHHDFHSCRCLDITVDGGFEYFRFLWKTGAKYRFLRLTLPKSVKRENFRNYPLDWLQYIDPKTKGLIKRYRAA